MKCAGLSCESIIDATDYVFVEEENFQTAMNGIETPERIYCHRCFPKGYICGTHYDMAARTKTWRRNHLLLTFRTSQCPEANVIQSDSGRDILMFITYRSFRDARNLFGYRIEVKPIKIGIRRAA
jgi:hypothetical protein